MPPDNPLVGTWRLVSWENRGVGDGGVSHPLGEDAVGYIMYGPDGHMSVAISRPDRARFAAGDLLDGSAEERAQAAETYVSYCGRYEFRGRRWSTSWNSACSPTGSAPSRSALWKCRGPVGPGHAADGARGSPTYRPPDLGARPNGRAIGSRGLSTQRRGRIVIRASPRKFRGRPFK